MKRALAPILALLILLALASGCAYNYADMGKELQAGLGNMSFDQAKEKFGEPSEVDAGAETFTAHWYTREYKGRVIDDLHLTFYNKDLMLRSYRYSYVPF